MNNMKRLAFKEHVAGIKAFAMVDFLVIVQFPKCVQVKIVAKEVTPST